MADGYTVLVMMACIGVY